ncbi:MAG: peptidoglycan-associated lipoprotein Pal [Acetobacteraceae bacterium]|nr:peptidoglycan-associated lipoprotein Pal [Acetobacteraceae bacterium]
MYSKILGAFLAVSLLAACSSSSDNPASARSGTGTGAVDARDPLAAGGDKIFFDLDRSVVRDDARATLDFQAGWLNQNKTVNVVVAGNSDERGTQEYNIALGNRRAFAAASYLTAKGVSANRISTVSYGKDRPIAPGSNEQAWAQNRNAITSVR